MTEIKLTPCPVCGRKPKVKYSYFPTGTGCTIQCKPLFRKNHLRCERYTASCERSLQYASEDWNKAADCANLPTPKEG